MLDPVVFQQICNDHQLYALYLYGSRVYGTNGPDSDFDFIGVGQFDSQATGIYDITCYTKERFARLLAEHEVSVLECVSQKPLAGINFDPPPIDKGVLRASISKKSSNSWVKCKKKLCPTADYNALVGLKSFFHAFRVLDFGIQIAEHGKVVDFGSRNQLWHTLCERPAEKWTWDELDKTFRAEYNTLSSEFVKVAPKIPKPSKV